MYIYIYIYIYTCIYGVYICIYIYIYIYYFMHSRSKALPFAYAGITSHIIREAPAKNQTKNKTTIKL